MVKKSAGLLVYRDRDGEIEVFLVHPGGPFWRNKDDGSWSIPKGEFADREDPFEAAKREFQEETGFCMEGEFQALLPVRQPGGKLVYAWMIRGDVDASAIRSNSFSMPWPPGSGNIQTFLEVDRGGWFDLKAARRKIGTGQVELLDQLQRILLNKAVPQGRPILEP